MKSLIITGKTNSGKSTIAKELEKRGLTRIIPYTTRPLRRNEKDGSDYHFITIEEFDKKEHEGFFAETASYNASFGFCKYGSSKEDYKDNFVAVLSPSGIKQINLKELNVLVVYLDIEEDELRMRALLRGDTASEIERRLAADRLDFREINKFAVKIDCNKLTSSQIADNIIYLLKQP